MGLCLFTCCCGWQCCSCCLGWYSACAGRWHSRGCGCCGVAASRGTVPVCLNETEDGDQARKIRNTRSDIRREMWSNASTDKMKSNEQSLDTPVQRLLQALHRVLLIRLSCSACTCWHSSCPPTAHCSPPACQISACTCHIILCSLLQQGLDAQQGVCEAGCVRKVKCTAMSCTL